jgi:hypothetical protein
VFKIQKKDLMATHLDKVKKKLLHWKEKADERRIKIKKLNIKLTRLEKRLAKAQGELADYKSAKRNTQVPRHPYFLGIMWLAVVFHIKCNISLRGTTKAITYVCTYLGISTKEISASTIRNWSIRLGLYYLSLQADAGEYVAIADESIVIGQDKLLLILGVKVTDSEQVKPVKMEDVVVLHVESRTSWKGEDIAKVIKEKVLSKGIRFSYALSDKGANLRKAFTELGLLWVEDCTHVLANYAEKLFADKTELNSLIKSMNLSRAKWILSINACYVPPKLRQKGRFHQSFAVYKWCVSILNNWNNLPANVQSELQYVQLHKDLIVELEQLHTVVEAISSIFKYNGINGDSIEKWNDKMLIIKYLFIKKHQIVCFKTEQYLQLITTYIRETSYKMFDQKKVMCCSDIIESMFGKYKNKGVGKIITDDAFKIAAYPKSISFQDVENAMILIDYKYLEQHNKEYKKPSLLAIRRKNLPKLATPF